MAKMFYTAEEVAEKLGKSVEQVLEMAKRGQIQEFRDRDKVMFKVDQIDLLAGDESEPSIPLALDDSGESFAAMTKTQPASASEPLDLSGTGMTVVDSNASGTGIGLADSGSNASRMPPTKGDTSALMDLTRESEETSLGAELLEEVYSSEENVELPAGSSGLFEPVEGDIAAPASIGGRAPEPFVPMLAAASVEQVEPGWSGLAAGLMVGVLIAAVFLALAAFAVATGGSAGIATSFAGNMLAWAGGLVGITLVCGAAGFFIGRASE
ncbi:MAG: helix-turn-helix domain-containing protein [Phycisphaerae bacterium]|nr:helix-turn-helix domain-containing protein [Phycisphaerae bacterium]